eukprot:scaffold173032_cov33-Tisochrysis_lutea.AAC.2
MRLHACSPRLCPASRNPARSFALRTSPAIVRLFPLFSGPSSLPLTLTPTRGDQKCMGIPLCYK